MEHCIVDLGIINYHPVITWTVPVAFFFLVVLAGIAFNIGRKSNLIVFILAMLLPVDWPPESPDNQYHLFK